MKYLFIEVLSVWYLILSIKEFQKNEIGSESKQLIGEEP